MEIKNLTREFRYNGVALPDPGAQYTLEQVRDFYAAMYPEITSAAIEGPENIGAKTIYTFRRAVGTKGKDHPMQKNPLELIAQERKRQIEAEGFTPTHDDEHEFGELALVAALYATPVRLFEQAKDLSGDVYLRDPWPSDWFTKWDKRRYAGEIVNPATHTRQERFNLLVKAGALIVAEMERIQRQLLADPSHGDR